MSRNRLSGLLAAIATAVAVAAGCGVDEQDEPQPIDDKIGGPASTTPSLRTQTVLPSSSPPVTSPSTSR